MENASKAVMIAGGVLIAIIVISLGMYIWGVGTGAFGSVEQKRAAELKEEQMVKFSQYVGVLYGSEVENCIRRVITFNEMYGTNMKVIVTGIDTKLCPKGYFSEAQDLFDKNEELEYKLNQVLRNDKYMGKLDLDDLGNIDSIIFEPYKTSEEE